MVKIQLRDGPALSQDAVLLALDLERNGHALTLQTTIDDGRYLVVSNRKTLTRDQIAGIKRHREEILALLAYDAPEPR